MSDNALTELPCRDEGSIPSTRSPLKQGASGTQCSASVVTREFFAANLHLSNAELAERTGLTANAVSNRLRRLKLYRSPEQLSAILSRTRPPQDGVNNNAWKGGVSKDNYRYKLRQVERYPDRVRARELVYRAVKSGKLVRQPCEVCGERSVQAHHDDYSKPLSVRWLCRPHHRQADLFRIAILKAA